MVTKFQQQVYDALVKVPQGRVTTYKHLARSVGCRGYRAVGMALNRNPFAPRVPCHRVVASDGSLGGFAWGSKCKSDLLEAEGVMVKDGRVVDFERVLFMFD